MAKLKMTTALCGLTVAISLTGWGSSSRSEISHVPWLDEVQQGLAEITDDDRLSPVLIDETGAAITTLPQWERRKQEIRRWWTDFLGLPVETASRPERTFKMLDREELQDIVRCLVEYEPQPGWKTRAYLLFPRDRDIFTQSIAPLPAVVVFHSTTNDTIRQPAGLTGELTKAFGLHLARRGYVAICPECFLWNDGPPFDYRRQVAKFTQQFPKSKGMAKMVLDGIASVDVLVSLPGVDSQRIGAVGHSLGGKEVLYLVALDERIRAAVSSEGGIGMSFSNWDAPWYLGEDVKKPGFAHDHHELLALIAPRAFLLIGGDSADGDKSLPYMREAWKVYSLFEKRPALGLWNHRQGHRVPEEALERIVQWFDAYLKNTSPRRASVSQELR